MPDTITCWHSKSRVVVQEKISRLNFLQMPSKLAQICLSSVVNCWFECAGALLNRSFFCLRIIYFFHVLLDWDKSKTFSSSLLSNRLAQRCSEVYISYSLLTISSNRYWLTTCGNNGSVISSQPVSEIMLRRLLRVLSCTNLMKSHPQFSTLIEYTLQWLSAQVPSNLIQSLSKLVKPITVIYRHADSLRTTAHPSITAAVLPETTWHSGKEELD